MEAAAASARALAKLKGFPDDDCKPSGSAKPSMEGRMDGFNMELSLIQGGITLPLSSSMIFFL